MANFDSLKPAYGKNEAKGIFVFIEHDGKRLEPVSLELLGAARQFAPGEKVSSILLGHNVRALAEEAVKHGADEVFLVDDAHLKDYATGPCTKALMDVVVRHRPDILLLGATQNGCDLAGRLAVRLQTGLTAHATALEMEKGTGNLIGWVPGFGGGIAAAVKCPDRRPQMFTVRPGVLSALPHDGKRTGNIREEKVEFRKGDLWTEVVGRTPIEALDITKAERIVALGRGTEGNTGPVKELAEALHAEVGGTRVAVDEGWLDKERMVGQTGYAVKPKVAVVCGVSGATQFTVGIENAGLVVAINSDPEAPIFEVADLCVVDDLFRILPALSSLARKGGA